MSLPSSYRRREDTMSYTLQEVCDHCGLDLGQHLVPDSRCPAEGATTHFFMAAYHPPKLT